MKQHEGERKLQIMNMDEVDVLEEGIAPVIATMSEDVDEPTPPPTPPDTIA